MWKKNVETCPVFDFGHDVLYLEICLYSPVKFIMICSCFVAILEHTNRVLYFFITRYQSKLAKFYKANTSENNPYKICYRSQFWYFNLYIQSFSLTECIVVVRIRKIGVVCLCVCVSVCVSVCVFVGLLSQKVIDRFWWNLAGWCIMIKSRFLSKMKWIGLLERKL